MRIECTIQRKNGTEVDIDGEIYNFIPTAKDKRHICDVKIRSHVGIFLAIPEAYQVADLGDEDKAADIVIEPDVTESALMPPGPTSDTDSEADTDKGEKNKVDKKPPAAKKKAAKKASARKSTKRTGRGTGK